ncbi:zinc-binding alcohol dehydrogenase [uncultured Cohaesibacter sp.]|uniref:zinc-dependent alcohol dehydrogenase n=1 Tax=uncultured Cohaesibacter sp. TaxID=1002546 RepID=UPI0029C8E3A7|nr:zinc-binding alcohol dehydrogenase [uncultured Cohaesibacter sp.]
MKTSKDQSASSGLALWFPSAERCALLGEALTEPKEGEVRVKALFSGISRGTEALVFHGQVPEEEQERMRGPHMGGSFSFPVKYGYSMVGRVEAGPDGLVGRSVFCLHPHQSDFITTANIVVPLPEVLPPRRAILAANMETALNIVWDARILPGDRVAVFGAGVVGSLTAFIASRIIGTEVVLVDPNSERRNLAQALDVAFAEVDALDSNFDVLINASASGDALVSALAHADFEARIVEASWYGTKTVTLPLGGAFHAKRLSIISSQVGAVSGRNRSRWSYSRRMSKALDLLCDPRLDAVISGESAFSDIVDAYPRILADPGTLCHCIRY